MQQSQGRDEAGLYGRFSQSAARFGARIAVEVQRRDGLEPWTYAELRAGAEATARRLADAGVGAGDRCALLADNDAHWCAAFLGILRLGAVPVPLDTTYTSAQIARLLTDSEVKLILAAHRFGERVEQARASSSIRAPTLGLTDVTHPDATSASALPPASFVRDDDPAVILYTSGTTSDPKGVVLTHGNLLGEIDATLHVITVTEDDAILGVLPLFHALAQVANLLLPFSVGARVVFLETLSTGDLLRALREREISVFCCVPQFFYLIHQRILEQVARAAWPRRLTFRMLLWLTGLLRERVGVNLGPLLFARVHRALGPRMRLLVTGGSRFDPRIGRDLYRLGFNILQAYGLTETSGAATVLRPGDRHVDSVGQALPGVELKILPGDGTAETDDGRATNGAQIGEVAIRGVIVSPGYFRRADANAETFRDGWLHTGDLGYLGPSGRLYITGRAKEVIVLGSGKNIYPEEIETHYARSPYIKELCVLGRTLADAPAAERLHALVVPDFELLRERKILNSREILRFEIENLSAELPGHKRIMSYDVIPDELPRTTTRKLKRFEIERRFEAERKDAGAVETSTRSVEIPDVSWVGDPRAARVLQILREAAHDASGIGPASNLELDLGLDSMERVELLASLETRLGISLPDEVAHRILTVGELIEVAVSTGPTEADEVGGEFDPWAKLLGDVSDEDPAIEPILVPRQWLTYLLYAGAKLLYGAAWLILGLRVSAREHLPASGPFLISPNHQSFLDAFLLASALPFRAFRDAFYVGASEYFDTPFRARVARLIRVVPVDPDTNLVRAMRAGAQGLRRGKILILFPEGERSIDAEIKTFKNGAAILSRNTGAPIVPVALDGIRDIWPRAGLPRLHKLLPFSGTRTRIRFGSPLDPPASKQQDNPDYASITQNLRDAVATMVDEIRGRFPNSRT